MLQNLELRCRRFSDQLQDITNELDALRQLIVQQKLGAIGASSMSEGLKERTISEQTEMSEEESVIGQLVVQPVRKKAIVRSLTEVRPDAYIFDNGQHIEYRYEEKEEERELEHLDSISIAGTILSAEAYSFFQSLPFVIGSRQQLNFKRQRTKSTESKTSNDSEGASDDVLSADDVAGLSIDILKSRAMQKRRDSASTTRRGSESGPGKLLILC